MSSFSKLSAHKPSYSSMSQCAAQTGIPLSEIKRAKKNGCSAFVADGGINVHPLNQWLWGEGRKKTQHVVDVNAARERDLNASAALKESKMRERDGQLVPLEFAEKTSNKIVNTVRQRLIAMPSECAHLCNPADPIHARVSLQSWLDANLPIMQSEAKPDTCPYCGQTNPKAKKEKSIDNE